MNPSLPLFEPLPPYQGTTKATRAASRSGAIAASHQRGVKVARVLALYAVPRTMQAVSELSGIPLASVCSIVGRLKDQGLVVDAGQPEHKVWANGRVTTRTRWVHR